LREGDVVSLYDLNGKRYMSHQAAGEIETVDTSRLLAGTYLLNVAKGPDTHSLKVIVRH
jgi:hypothetical protein